MNRRCKWALGLLLLSAVAACASSPKRDSGPNNDHMRDGRFYNPWEEFKIPWAALWRALISANPYKGKAYGPVPVAPQLELPQQASPAVTWVGHATFAIQDSGDLVLTDPHFGKRALIVRRATPPGIPIDAVQHARFAVVSHNHYDHLDEFTVRALPEEMLWVVPAGLAEWFRDLGRENVVELGWGQSTATGGWVIHCVPVQHWSRRIGQPRNTTQWCGWVMESPQARYFFAGDTGYFHGFRDIGQKFPNIDVAMLPIGAWQPREFLRYQHMGPEDALRAFTDLGAKMMIPMHWGAFPLSQEPLAEPMVTLQDLLATDYAALSPNTKILSIGESWPLPTRLLKER